MDFLIWHQLTGFSLVATPLVREYLVRRRADDDSPPDRMSLELQQWGTRARHESVKPSCRVKIFNNFLLNICCWGILIFFHKKDLVQIRYLKQYLSFNIFFWKGEGVQGLVTSFWRGASIFITVCEFVAGSKFAEKTSRHLWTPP